jgi:hypothetical protein
LGNSFFLIKRDRNSKEFYPIFFAFSLPRNASRICTICLRFGGGSFSTWLNRRQRRVS